MSVPAKQSWLRRALFAGAVLATAAAAAVATPQPAAAQYYPGYGYGYPAAYPGAIDLAFADTVRHGVLIKDYQQSEQPGRYKSEQQRHESQTIFKEARIVYEQVAQSATGICGD